MRSLVKPVIAAAEVEARLFESAGIRGRVLGELTDGWFNAVFRVQTSDGRHVIVKVAPLPETPVLRYELGIMATEADFYRRVARLSDIPVPELIHEDPGFLVIGAVDGITWAMAKAYLTSTDHAALLRELGQITARLHALPSPDGRFGCPAPQSGLAADDWPAAFTAMVEAILDDAARWQAPIGISPAEVRRMLADGSDALAEVRTASLIHFDLWPANIFIARDRSRIVGIIDPERAIWGDPAAELVSLQLCGSIAPEGDLLAGYGSAGGQLDPTPAFRYRLALYRMYFGLLCVTECCPRGYTADHVARCRTWLDTWISELRTLRSDPNATQLDDLPGC